jgi:hypothetical protein
MRGDYEANIVSKVRRNGRFDRGCPVEGGLDVVTSEFSEHVKWF